MQSEGIDAVVHAARASLARSAGRRATAARRRRRLLRARGTLLALAVAMTTLSAAAFAASGGTSAPSGSSAPGHHASAKLGPGARGVAVSALQRALGVRATGRYDGATRRAVRSFQKAHGLIPDGVAGSATLAALGLDSSAEAAVNLRRGRIVAPTAELAKIARCESGGNPQAVSADGRFFGKYQFDQQTREPIGGSGNPAQASEAEQDRLALALLRARGTAPWPNCA
ncbi:MAG: hypothetical protein NVS2B6_09350 [Thermoleophilaceae bacterium]